jgi:hypothetical protein
VPVQEPIRRTRTMARQVPRNGPVIRAADSILTSARSQRELDPIDEGTCTAHHGLTPVACSTACISATSRIDTLPTEKGVRLLAVHARGILAHLFGEITSDADDKVNGIEAPRGCRPHFSRTSSHAGFLRVLRSASL